MRRVVLDHPWLFSLALGGIAFAVTDITLACWASEMTTSLILADQTKRPSAVLALGQLPSEAASEMSPQVIAANSLTADKDISQWLGTWKSESHVLNSDLNRDEQQAVPLGAILKRTTLDGQTLLNTARALVEDKNARDRLIGEDFYDKAMTKTISQLSGMAPSDSAAKPLISILWDSETFEGGIGHWPIRLEVYAALIRWEPAGSAKLYRARLKHADVLILCDQPQLALKEMAAFVKDVNNGAYPSPNQKDIAEVYWFAYQRAGLYAQGLKYLTDLIGKFKGTSDEQRLTAIWIYALAQSGDLQEAQSQYASWLAINEKTASKTALAQLQLRLQEARQMCRARGSTTLPSL